MPPLVLDGTNGISGVDGTASNPAIEGTDSNTGIFYPAADTVAIGTGGTERLRVDSAGNAGLGVTPSAWNSSIKALQGVGGWGAFYSDAGYYGATGLVKNSVWTSVSGTSWNYVNTQPALRYEMGGSAGLGTHAWYTAPSGTAGNAITFTQAMTLDASGNLGIGTSSPSFATGMGIAINGGAGQARLVLKNNNTGDASTDGLQIGVATDSSAFIEQRENSHLFFATNAIERARITSGGDFLIGTTASAAPLSVYAPTATATGNRCAIFVSTSNSDNTYPCIELVKKSNTTTTANIFQRFYVNDGSSGSGQINANGASAAAFGTFSDARLKENIVDLPSQFNNILALRPVEFDYIESEGGGHQLGFIAQEVQEIYPDLVGERADGMLTLSDMNKNDARLIKAFQELAAKVTALEAEIAALKGAA